MFRFLLDSTLIGESPYGWLPKSSSSTSSWWYWHCWLSWKKRSINISRINSRINYCWNRKAAVLTKKAGAAGAQIHSSHGYLYSTFLSLFYNRRNDKCGGSLDGRARIVAETAGAIRKSCGPDFSVLIKMNANDFLPGGMTPDLASRYVNILKNKNDLFEI